MMWNSICNEHDLTEFLKIYDYFHDSCLTELRYVSGAFVSDNLAMHPVNDKRKLYVIFQRQSKENMSVEMEFSGLTKLCLNPENPMYTCEICDISLFFENGKIYWGDSSDFARQRENYQGTWLCADRVKWRMIDVTWSISAQ